jgi:hypothetical protein
MTDVPQNETKADRERRLARDRQRRKRLADENAKLRAAAVPVTFEAYKGTQADLALICELGGFEEQAEAITLILRHVANLAKRDRHAFDELIRIPSRPEVTHGQA